MKREHTNDLMQEKRNNFGVKYGNQENITKKAEWLINMAKNLGLEVEPKAEIHIYLF